MRVNHAEVFANNPWVTSLTDGQTIALKYPTVSDGGDRRYIAGHIDYLSDYLGIRLRCHSQRPHLYLDDIEKERYIEEPYCLINSGYRLCNTTKHWGYSNFQKVCDWIRKEKRLTVVQVGDLGGDNRHQELKGAINLLGKTRLRQVFSLAYNSLFVIGAESMLVHCAAAFDRPSICIKSGWNNNQWCNYHTSTVLTKRLDCNALGGCWKNRTMPQGDDKDKALCKYPTALGDEYIPKCLAMISPDEVIKAVQDLYTGGLVA